MKTQGKRLKNDPGLMSKYLDFGTKKEIVVFYRKEISFRQLPVVIGVTLGYNVIAQITRTL